LLVMVCFFYSGCYVAGCVLWVVCIATFNFQPVTFNSQQPSNMSKNVLLRLVSSS
jgi:hypothetical protein